MAKKKRITRKQLLKEPDEFLTLSARMMQFAGENQRQISYVLIGIVVVGLSLFAFRFFSNLSEKNAYAVFDEGLVLYMGQGAMGKSPSSDEAAKEKFAELLRNHSSSKAAQLSLPLYADVCYKTGDYDKAIELYQRAMEELPAEGSLLKSLLNGLGYAYEGKDDFKSAAGYFQKLADSQGEFMKADAYFNLGRMYEKLNDIEKAREAYEKVANDYSESVHSQIARDKALSLKG